ncbi:hypothetical protein DNTS_027404 [Danionella cerebrum]|uniref:NHS-like protein 1 n=1 Tax=Danionella cerebrum TaxID=2873325 RepID=A0A553N2K6_9TELE|nr:hypothetical protein DNTS_027404 [Danionella translucida]
MIAYVECLSTEPAGKCWNKTYYEDEDELLPLYTRKLNLQPKTEGSLRRRLLTSKIHQQQDALWAPRPWTGPSTRKGTVLQGQPNHTFSPSIHDWRAVSSLDEESKWSVHYTAPWHQQENVFLPGSRPACVEDLHHQAKVNLKTVLRECDKLRKDGFRSSQYYSQSPGFSPPSHCESVQLDEEKTEKKKKTSESSSEEEKLVYSMPPQTPLQEHSPDMDIQRSWTSCLPLPTPEEKMRLQAQSVAADVIPINITGENFDRQASFRRSVANTDTIIRRPKRVQRRKTITGVPDNIQTEIANKEQTDSRTHSGSMRDQYSPVSRVGSVNSTLRRSDMCDSGLQTEEVKIVPPSMRRIRAQRGHGKAAQMASVSSSSSISTMSDSNGICYRQLSESEQSFHSLSRQGSYISDQHSETNYNSFPYRMSSGSTSSLSYQFNTQHGSSSSLQMLSDSRCNVSNSLKLAENNYYMGSEQTSSPGLFSISGALDNSIPYGHKRTEGLHRQSHLSSAQVINSADAPLSGVSSCYESTASLCTGTLTETESQCSTLDGGNCSSPNCDRRDSNFSESSNQSCSTLTTDQWTYVVPPKDITSSCSSPVSHIYGMQESSPSKMDTNSLFSDENEGFYTPMDSGLKSQSYNCIDKRGEATDNLYKCKDHHSQGDRVSLHSNNSLTRSISLRKAKKPPIPPLRTDSLRRKPNRKTRQGASVLSEQLISSLQETLELNLKTPALACSEQKPCGKFEDPWVLRPRSQSTVSAASSGMSAPAAVCPVTPTHSDSSSQRSDYAESWDFYMDYPSPQSEQRLSANTTQAGSSEENQGVIVNACNNTGFPSSPLSSSQPKLASSQVYRLTSPSSGYSSRSNTPTAGTPVTSVRAKSPRPKPKVPERKSSLRSSVSSSSTSLSSITSDSTRNLPPPPPPPPLPDMNSELCKKPTIPPFSDVSSALEERPYSESSVEPEDCDDYDFPNPPPEVFESLSENRDAKNPAFRPPLPPKPILFTLPVPPPSPPPLPPPLLPELNLRAAACLKIEGCHTKSKSDETKGEHKRNQTGEQEKSRRPVITAQALQMVQLRPIKVKEIETGFTVLSSGHFEVQEHTRTIINSGKSMESVIIKQIDTTVTQSGDRVQTSAVEKLTDVADCSLNHFPDEHANDTEQDITLHISETNPVLTTEIYPDSSNSPQSCPLKQKPPISPKKPHLSLLVQHPTQKPKGFELHKTQEIPKLEQVNEASATNIDNLQGIPLTLEEEEESDSDSSTPILKSRLSLSSELSSSSFQDLELSDLFLNEHDITLSDKDFGLCDDKSTSDDDAVFESSTEHTSEINTDEGYIGEMLTPVQRRTTEDLFAAIHRSKRKVLGRGDSEEERCRSIFPSPPVTPTTPCTILTHQSNSVQRNVRRSSTSNDSFKALLLKKGSRSESSFRMSAAEILKCTDPRFQRANSEHAQADRLSSPSSSRKAHEEWARTEGPLPRLFAEQTSVKYGRSRTPPSAASSRYNSRNRIPSRQMTAICEREGELAETTDCCISTESFFVLPMSSNSIACAQGST